MQEEDNFMMNNNTSDYTEKNTHIHCLISIGMSRIEQILKNFRIDGCQKEREMIEIVKMKMNIRELVLFRFTGNVFNGFCLDGHPRTRRRRGKDAYEHDEM